MPRLEVVGRCQDAAICRDDLRREEGILVYAVEAGDMGGTDLYEDDGAA